MPTLINSYIHFPQLSYPHTPNNSLPVVLYTLLCLTFIGLSLLIAFCISKYAENKWNKKATGIYLLLAGITTILLLCFFEISISSIKGIILFLIILYASHSDIQTREVDDYIPIMLVVTAFIGVELSDIGSMFVGSIALALPQLFISVIKPEQPIGGADIKLSAACGLLLGFEKGVIGFVLGLLLAIICTLIMNKLKNKKAEAIPLIPYLAAGFMTAYFI